MNGLQLKEAGMQLALFNAGDRWVDYIIEKLRAFCKAKKDMGEPVFKFEEFRMVAETCNWDMPPSPNAWGPISTKACKLGLIKWTEKYEPAESKKTHGHPVKVWVAL